MNDSRKPRPQVPTEITRPKVPTETIGVLYFGSPKNAVEYEGDPDIKKKLLSDIEGLTNPASFKVMGCLGAELSPTSLCQASIGNCYLIAVLLAVFDKKFAWFILNNILNYDPKLAKYTIGRLSASGVTGVTVALSDVRPTEHTVPPPSLPPVDIDEQSIPVEWNELIDKLESAPKERKLFTACDTANHAIYALVLGLHKAMRKVLDASPHHKEAKGYNYLVAADMGDVPMHYLSYILVHFGKVFDVIKFKNSIADHSDVIQKQRESMGVLDQLRGKPERVEAAASKFNEKRSQLMNILTEYETAPNKYVIVVYHSIPKGEESHQMQLSNGVLLFTSHVYYLKHYCAETQQVCLINPHNSFEQLWISLQDFEKWCNNFSYATIPDEHQVEPTPFFQRLLPKTTLDIVPFLEDCIEIKSRYNRGITLTEHHPGLEVELDGKSYFIEPIQKGQNMLLQLRCIPDANLLPYDVFKYIGGPMLESHNGDDVLFTKFKIDNHELFLSLIDGYLAIESNVDLKLNKVERHYDQSKCMITTDKDESSQDHYLSNIVQMRVISPDVATDVMFTLDKASSLLTINNGLSQIEYKLPSLSDDNCRVNQELLLDLKTFAIVDSTAISNYKNVVKIKLTAYIISLAKAAYNLDLSLYEPMPEDNISFSAQIAAAESEDFPVSMTYFVPKSASLVDDIFFELPSYMLPVASNCKINPYGTVSRIPTFLPKSFMYILESLEDSSKHYVFNLGHYFLVYNASSQTAVYMNEGPGVLLYPYLPLSTVRGHICVGTSQGLISYENNINTIETVCHTWFIADTPRSCSDSTWSYGKCGSFSTEGHDFIFYIDGPNKALQIVSVASGLTTSIALEKYKYSYSADIPISDQVSVYFDFSMPAGRNGYSSFKDADLCVQRSDGGDIRVRM